MENHHYHDDQESEFPIPDLKVEQKLQLKHGNLEKGSKDVEFELREEKGVEKCKDRLGGIVENEAREGGDGVVGLVEEGGVVESGELGEMGGGGNGRRVSRVGGNGAGRGRVGVVGGGVVESETSGEMGRGGNGESLSGVGGNGAGKDVDGVVRMEEGGVVEGERRGEMGSGRKEESLSGVVENEVSEVEKVCDGVAGMMKDGEVVESEMRDEKCGEKDCDGNTGKVKENEVVKEWTREEKGREGIEESLSGVVEHEVGKEKVGGGVAGILKEIEVMESETGNYMGSLTGVVETEVRKEMGGNGITGKVNEYEGESLSEVNEVGEEKARDGGHMEKDQHPFPIRPEAEDCGFYMKTGTCKFGLNCKFNHPVKRKNQHYLRSGGNKAGNASKYTHTKGNTSIDQSPAELNFLGLPIRPGGKECPYYMRTGSCKYGANCRFNHPDPTTIGSSEPSGTGNGGPVLLHGASQANIASWSSPVTSNETLPYMPMIFPPPPAVPSQNSDWNSYPVVYPPERSIHQPSAYIKKSPLNERNVYKHQQQQYPVEEYPERPGQPECSYYLRNGDCKFKSNCKYHHPKNRNPKALQCALSDKGLPMRPGQNVCTYYSHYGICKFGPACKYDHPINLTPNVGGGNVPIENVQFDNQRL